jgi:AAA15 family ATPase/GTPase
MEYKTRYSRCTEILLPSEEPFSNYLLHESNSFSPISLINILIGTNNSGKSRLLRSLFSLKDYHNYDTGRYNQQTFYDLFEEMKLELAEVFNSVVYKHGDIVSDFLQYISDIQHPISLENPIHKVVQDKISLVIGCEEKTIVSPYINDAETIIKKTREIGNKFLKLFEQIMEAKISDHRYYIPILRGMRPLGIPIGIPPYTDLYRRRTEDDYFEGVDMSEPRQIFTGLDLYQILKEKLLGEPEDRELVKKFENFLSKNFFESKQVTLIPMEKGDNPKVVHIKIGSEPQLPIYKLGDGLQSLIICTFNIVTESNQCLFFIEEPDMFMHPSMQRSFLEVLAEYDQHQYFITSHSNHFLDMTIDFDNISVFHFSKHEGTQPQFHIRPSSPRDRQILLDLGVRNSSVFITNATIWVEGITDRLYLKAYMKKYIDELELSEPEKYSELIKLKEDYHYSFVEYQGANLTHWSFDPDEDDDEYKIRAKSICGHAFLIADGDIGSHLKGDRKAVYEKMLGERFLVLQVKEIENLIPVEILKKVVAEKFKKYEGNIERIKYKDYAKPDTPIGRYLDRLLKAIPEGKTIFAAINKSKSKSEGSGTIKSKSPFCDDAIRFMQNSEWTLTDDLKDICVNIFKHIITQNKNS